MRLAHTSDLHVDEHSRFQETRELLRWMAKDMLEFKPDLIINAGDASPVGVRPSTPMERAVLSDFYLGLASIAPVVIVRGNHDIAEGDVDIYGKLNSEYPIYVFSRPNVISILDGSNGVAAIVGGLPWPSKGYLAGQATTGGGPNMDERCRQAMREILYGMKASMKTELDVPRILVGHLNVAGSDIGGFSLIGTDVEVTAEELEMVGADYVALGHVHKHQNFGPRIWYSGSPRRVDFGEEDEIKGYLRVTVERGQEPGVSLRHTPVADMQTIRVDVSAAASGGCIPIPEQVRPDANVRVLVKINEEQRATFDEARLLREIGADRASRLKVEYRMVPKTRVRSVAIQSAKTDADRLKAYLGTLDPAPGPEIVARLLEKLETVG